jgi:uncharacterized Zn finger protein (UPF0148 family)
MFDDVIKELKRVERGIKVPISLPLDDEGYFDRRCASAPCHAEFKVLYEDWKSKVTDEQVFCPICRYEAPATEWNTSEQDKYIKAVAVAHIKKLINKALVSGAHSFNRQQRPGFVTLSMSVKPSATPIIVPIEAEELMRQRLECEVCQCKYSSIGPAYFCPACGHNSAGETFDRTVEIVRQVMVTIPTLRDTLRATYDEDLAQGSVQSIIEDSLGRLVGAFQRLSEALFEQLPGAATMKRRKNTFQNLAEASSLWRAALGVGYEDILSPGDMAELSKLFQQRHLIAHRNGIIDQEYIDKSGDKTYTIGQRLVVREVAVLRIADLISKLASELRKKV